MRHQKESKFKCLMSFPLLLTAMMRAGPHKVSFLKALGTRPSSSNYHQTIFFDTFSNILSGIRILSHIFSEILSGILSGISSEILCC